MEHPHGDCDSPPASCLSPALPARFMLPACRACSWMWKQPSSMCCAAQTSTQPRCSIALRLWLSRAAWWPIARLPAHAYFGRVPHSQLPCCLSPCLAPPRAIPIRYACPSQDKNSAPTLPRQVVVFGRSLGGAVAVYGAVQQQRHLAGEPCLANAPGTNIRHGLVCGMRHMTCTQATRYTTALDCALHRHVLAAPQLRPRDTQLSL